MLFFGGGGVLSGGVKLWLRKVAGPVVFSLIMGGRAVVRDDWSLWWRVVTVVVCAGFIAVSARETWVLLRGGEQAEDQRDRWEAEDARDWA